MFFILIYFLPIMLKSIQDSFPPVKNMEVAKSTNSTVKRKGTYDRDKPLKFSIEVNEQEWNSIKPSETIWSDRVTLVFPRHWTDFMLNKIWQKYPLECPFPMHNHKFYKRRGFPYLKFDGECGECKATIVGTLQDPPDVFPLSILIDTYDTRDIFHKEPRQARNFERKEKSEDLRHMTATKYRHQQANKCLNDSGSLNCSNEERPNLNTTAALNEMRQDGLKKNNDFSGDVVSQVISLRLKFPCIRGFSTVPVAIFYWLVNQIKLWNEVGGLGYSISIDASGKYCKPLQIIEGRHSPPLFFYNITIHYSGKVYTISQMLSSQHDVVQISTWLSAWVKTIDVMPNEVDVDCAFALLNSTCLTFNRCTYIQTLNKSLEYVIQKDKQKKKKLKIIKAQLPPYNVKRDRAHLIKAMATWKCFKGNNWTKKDLYLRVVGFSLEVQDLDLIKDIVKCLFIVCKSQYETVVCKAALLCFEKIIGEFDYNLRFSMNNNIEDCCEDSCCLLKETDLGKDHKIVDDELKGCKARTFILDLQTEAQKLMSSSWNSHVDGQENSYYLPTIIRNLVSLYSQFTAWTNIMHPYYSFNPRKVSSSCASEVYYRISKREYGFSKPQSLTNFLLEHIPLMEEATKLGRRAVKLKDHENSTKTNVCVEPNKYLQIDADVPSFESFYISNITEQEKRKREDSVLVEVPKKIKIDHFEPNVDNLKHNTISKGEKNGNCCMDGTSNSNLNLLKHKSIDEEISQIFSVKLSTYKYLLNMYESSHNLSYINLNACTLNLENFKSLEADNYVHDNVVDTYLIIKSREWKNINYIPSSQTAFILGDQWNGDHGEDWCLYDLRYDFPGYIFLPFCRNNHWCLVVLNAKEQIAIFCDSLKQIVKKKLDDKGKEIENKTEPTREEDVKEAFEHYLSNCKETNVLKNIEWKWIPVDLPKQGDYHSCGPFITHFMGYFAGEEQLSMRFNPSQRRQSVARLLLNNIHANTDICLYCFNIDKNHSGSGFRMCKSCTCWGHKSCMYRYRTRLINGQCEWCVIGNNLS